MMGPGYGGYMMGPGYGNYAMGRYGYCWSSTPGTYEGKSPTQKDTEPILKDYVGGNPNLKVGQIKDKGTYFEGTIVTKDNSLVYKILVDKNTGEMRSFLLKFRSQGYMSAIYLKSPHSIIIFKKREPEKNKFTVLNQ